MKTARLCVKLFKKRRKVEMSSNSKKTGSIRNRKRTSQGKKRKKVMSKISTPAFPIHVEKDA